MLSSYKQLHLAENIQKVYTFIMKWLYLFVILLILTGGLWYFKLKPATKTVPTQAMQTNCDGIQIIEPQAGSKVSSPVKVKVVVDNTKSKCRWTVFEGQAGVIQMQGKNSDLLGNSILSTTDNWMQDGPVTYTGSLTFTTPADKDIALIIDEENPSGKPNAKQIKIPLKN